mgnify:FL=1
MIMKLQVKDPISGFSHLVGALLSVLGCVLLIYYAASKASPWHIVGFAIFGTSLILLYTASTLYHLLKVSERGTKVLRKIDHMMIYILIAGTYTPICLIPLRGGWGWSLLVGIWVLAVTGIILKGVWFSAPRWLSTLFYGIMGWLVVIAFWPLSKTVPASGIGWVIAGGIYTIGAVIYGLKRPNFTSRFGFHELFHFFVLAGSFCHFWVMYQYILYLK